MLRISAQKGLTSGEKGVDKNVLKGADINSKLAPCLRLSPHPFVINLLVGNVLEWLERRDGDRHCLGSKPTRAIPLCP